MPSNQYFAALPPDDLASELQKRTDSFYRFMMQSGILKKWRKSYLSYYGSNSEKSSWEVNSSGEQGELSVLVSNEYRNLISHLLVLTTQARPAMECRAANTDYDSQVQCILGNSLLEYYLKESKLERRLREATEIGLVLDYGFLFAGWDVTLGDEIAADPLTNQIIRNGDIIYKSLTPLDVPYDFTKRSADENDWYIVREYKNKYDLIAQYPDKADDILAISRDAQQEYVYRFDNFFYFEGVDSPDIPVYTFYHRKTPALRDGRLYQFLSSNCWLFDGPTPYRKLPLTRIAPAEMIAKAFGYTPATDLMSLQDVVDAIISAVVTNVTTFGVNNIWCPPGHNLEVTELASGMNLFESKVEPKPINFASFPPELMNVMQFLISRMETLSGVNAVARGNPPSADMSGSALALIQSMALQFNSGLQQSYVELLENTGQLTINHLQDFAKSPRIAMIAGKFQQYQAETFTNQDIAGIQRVHVDMGNPLSQTVSGRMTMAQDLLKNELIKTADQYMMVMSTGRLEPLIEGEQALLLAMRQENEALAAGQQVPVVSIEMHHKHVPTHYNLIASPSAKKDPLLVQNTLAHIQEHMNAWRQLDPQLAQVLGIPPLPPPPPPPGMLPPGAPGPQMMPPHPQGSPGPHGAPPHPPGPHAPPHRPPVHGTVPQSAPNPGETIENPQNPMQQAATQVRAPLYPEVAGSNNRWTPNGPVPMKGGK